MGWSSAYGNPNQHATIWNGTTITDLNTVLTPTGIGWTLVDAVAINILGQIVGDGVGPLGEEAFLLTPCDSCQIVETLPPPLGAVPELSTWAMMLLGFAGLGFAGYHQARKTRVAPNPKACGLNITAP